MPVGEESKSPPPPQQKPPQAPRSLEPLKRPRPHICPSRVSEVLQKLQLEAQLNYCYITKLLLVLQHH